MRPLHLFILFAIFLAAGCVDRRVVQVVDAAGKPVAGAMVEAVSLSMNTGPNTTDATGEAELPSNVQGARWIAVSKAGFERACVDVPKQWPLRVTLKPTTRPQAHK